MPAVYVYNVTGETKISNCLIKADSDTAYQTRGIYIDDLTHAGTYKIWNNIIYGGFFDGGIFLDR